MNRNASVPETWLDPARAVTETIAQEGRIDPITRWLASFPPSREALDACLQTIGQGFLELGILTEAAHHPDTPPHILMAHQVLVQLWSAPQHRLPLYTLIDRSNHKPHLLCEALSWLHALHHIKVTSSPITLQLTSRGRRHAQIVESPLERFYRTWQELPYYVLKSLASNIKTLVLEFNQQHPDAFAAICRTCGHCRPSRTPDQAFCAWLEHSINLEHNLERRSPG